MRFSSGIVGFFFATIGVVYATTVICEPEPGSGPNDEGLPPGPYGYHTTNATPYQQTWDYWYEVTPSAGESINSFEVYTGLQYDSDLDFFLSLYQPAGWTNTFGSSYSLGRSVHWYNISGNVLSGSVSGVFGFDHRNDGIWGAWSSGVDGSGSHAAETNGYGYLVHVPGTHKPGPPDVYVTTNGSHTYPFTNWVMAARDIQSGIDTATQGSTVHVSNGTYRLTNEIVVERSMTIQSMNGPGETVVDAGGAAVATRCFSLLTNDIVLRGLTIRGGHSVTNGGGVYSESQGGECVVDSCIIESNSAANGAGLFVYGSGWLVQSCRVQNCTIRNNRARYSAGGLYAGGLYKDGSLSISNCLFVGNFASNNAGGIEAEEWASVRNSVIAENTCSSNGGGIYFGAGGEVASCTVVSNSAGIRGGGVFSTADIPEAPPGCLYYSSGGHVRNSILYGNSAPNGPNYFHGDFNWIYDHVCAIPRPIGNGNIAGNPRWAAGAYRLSADSPCVNAGTNEAWMTGVADVDGGARIVWDVVDIGADEFDSESLACGFDVAWPSGVSPLTNVFAARVQGTNVAGLFYRWDFNGDGVYDLIGYGLAVVTNVFTGYTNVSVQLTVTNSAREVAMSRKDNCIRTGPAAVYVSPSGAGSSPYESWGSSATTLQDAVSIAVAGTVVFVSNGVYVATNEIHVGDGVSMVSMGGAEVTVVEGQGSHRCFYLNHERAVIDGFTICNGKAGSQDFPGGSGGGAFVECGGIIRNCAVVSNTASGTKVSGYGGGGVYCWQGGLVENCLLQGNTSAHDGGGVECWRGGTVRDCLIERNTAAVGGGGALCEGNSLLESCTIVFNEAAWFGGGTYSWYGGEIRNNIISSNVAPDYGNYGGVVLLPNVAKDRPQQSNHGYAYNCVPEGDPDPGRGNIVGDPEFVDQGAGNYRPATNSPSVDVGINGAWMVSALDFEGKPRIINGAVDMGAYESIPMGLDSDGDGMPDWWEWDWAHSLSNMLATADGDEDRFVNLSEYQAGTRPLDGDSFLGLLMPLTRYTETGLVVQWQSASNRTYRLERSTNLVIGFSETAAVDIPATPPMNVYTDATAVLNGPYMYRVRTSP